MEEEEMKTTVRSAPDGSDKHSANSDNTQSYNVICVRGTTQGRGYGGGGGEWSRVSYLSLLSLRS